MTPCLFLGPTMRARRCILSNVDFWIFLLLLFAVLLRDYCRLFCGAEMLNGAETTFTVSKNGAKRCLTDTNGSLRRCVGLGEEAVGIKRCEEPNSRTN